MIFQGSIYDLSGTVAALPAMHLPTLISIPCSDDLAETCYEASTSDVPTAIIVEVHSFSGDYNEIAVNPAMSNLLEMENVAVVCPNLFGGAGNPHTCGSPIQLAHLNDVINYMKSLYGNLPVFFVAVSGGAGLGPTYMGAYPGIVSGASFWCGYHDLGQWYSESITAGTVYHTLMDETFGGAPTGSLASTYTAQSPSGVCNNMINSTVFINDGLLDTDILPHHRQDLRDQITGLSGVVCNYISYPNMGHAIDYPTAISQIQSLR